MRKMIICLLCLAATATNIFAQDENDALRYSFTTYFGTARGMAIGNAVGSIGADFSCLSVNPAGIGIYKSSELMFSPSFSVSKNNGTYLGTPSSEHSSKFNLANFGMIISNKQGSKGRSRSGWNTVNFGFGMNRSASFKNEYSYTGKNYNSSLIESYADDFNSLGGINTNSLNNVNYSAYGAYQTYLIDLGQGADSNKAIAYVPYTAGLNQTKKVTEKGGMNAYLISVGANYRDRLMLGATLDIVSLQYNRTLRFNEEDASGDHTNNFKYMNYTERLETSGTGIDLKLGAIFKPHQNFRMGFALHTPTHIELNDISSISMVSHTDSLLLQNNPGANPVTTFNQDSALIFNYSMNSPYKAIMSATLLFGKMGFITTDLEYVGYESMKYRFGIGYEKQTDAINRVIQESFKDALNLRIGAEARIKNLSIRAGIAHYGSPYSATTIDGAKNKLSAGVGYRDQYWFFDASYIYSMQKVQEIPYILTRNNANIQPASIENKTGNMVLTFGVKF